MKKSFKLSLAAVMVALSFVLSLLGKVIPSPWIQGGALTIGAAVPIMSVSVVCGTGYGFFSALVYGILQLLTGFYAPPARNVFSFMAVILLDYIAAFGVYGLTGLFYRLFGKRSAAISLAGGLCMLLRYFCHVASGMLVWGAYARNQSAFIYSVIYNAGYMLPECIITVVILCILSPLIKRLEVKYGE